MLPLRCHGIWPVGSPSRRDPRVWDEAGMRLTSTRQTDILLSSLRGEGRAACPTPPWSVHHGYQGPEEVKSDIFCLGPKQNLWGGPSCL